MRTPLRLEAVQSPIIPLIGQWLRETPNSLSLGQGMVSYPPPAAALAAIQGFGERNEDHFYAASLGNPQLLALIRAKLQQDNAIDCSQHYQLMVTAGSNMAFLNVLLAITDPGDEVILPLPYYFNQEMAVRMLGCVPVTVPCLADYQLDLNALKAAISAKTRAIVTVSPNNPSGAVYPEADLRAVNALCQEYGIYHISDEAYEYFVYESARHFSPASLPAAASHTISLYSLSKAYGFASWRIGYVLFPEALLPALLKIQDTNLISPPLINQLAAIGAMDAGSGYCREKLLVLAEIRQQVIAQLQDIADICQVQPTRGAFYFLLKIHTQLADLELAEQLVKVYGVAVIPGCAFGLNDGCYLRLSYGMLDRQNMVEAINRLIVGLRALCNTSG